MTRRPVAIEERFWKHVNKTESCWLWTGPSTGSGNRYGQAFSNGKKVRAHRVSYEMEYGPIPPGMVIDHTCHAPKCVRPSHLQAVTQKQNNENRSGAPSNSKSGIRGVSWHKTGKWVVAVSHNGRHHTVGYFTDIKEAEAAAIAKRNELFTNNLKDRRANGNH